jgi:gamma-glutamyltranspeptidase/glutathione hydrolase
MLARHKAAIGAMGCMLVLCPGAAQSQGSPIVSGRTAVAPHAMVASNSGLASAAGVEILRRGGNAVDAAVAVGFALAVTHPEAGNIGGGGYMVIRLADGRSAAFDYREIGPLAATRDMFLDSAGHPTDASRVGYLASGVPGAVAGLTAAEAAFGTLGLRAVMAPAIKLARDGFVVDSDLHASLVQNAARITPFAGRDRFFPSGVPLAVGAKLVQPRLAWTLSQIAEGGAQAFYHGPIADSIVAEEKRGSGRITLADLARYRVMRRVPIVSTYRGDTLLSMPPSSSGGVTVAETLNILDTFDPLPPFGSTAYAHDLSDAFQRAYIDRNDRIGDPDFVKVPVDHLIDAAYARALRATIRPDRAVPTPALATARSEGTQTTHYSVVDATGNAVATTTTINDLYGSGVYVRGAGFFLNNEMDDFTVKVGAPNQFGLVQGAQNAVEPGKRMLSSMSPTIVLDHSGHVLLVVGGRGGSRIPTSVIQVISNVIDYHMGLEQALREPRLHHQALPDTLRYEPGALSSAVADSLQAMGYALGVGRAAGTCTAILRTTGSNGQPVYDGAVDPRAPGGAVGY